MKIGEFNNLIKANLQASSLYLESPNHTFNSNTEEYKIPDMIFRLNENNVIDSIEFTKKLTTNEKNKLIEKWNGQEIE